MLRLAWSVLLGGTSAGCGFAAVGVALYGAGPSVLPAAALFGGAGLAAGVLCAGLHLVFDGLPARAAPAVPADAVAEMVRATLASAAAGRAPRSGSAADRRPPVRPSATTSATTTPAPAPVAAPELPRFASSAFGA